ncbi:CapA family protein [Chelatococcus sp. SYSU_G07232]|uniref:CapA family protein n=1 Tax=Chelatococcus albus TaxID=3047466 RepID=A0ABT7AE04_9HYPH|nr:CapA family protein [Chelatococcus sp. SYSU_G07232]MDJ1156821.1 CapA family protein [Chelatococcus sp. SYSU_G07232]
MGDVDPSRPGATRTEAAITIFLCGDVMIGRGIDQVLPHPSDPVLYEPCVASATDYVRLAELANGPIPRPVGFDYPWGEALAELRRVQPDVRVINLETSITRSDAYLPKGINYRMSPDNAQCLRAGQIDCCVLANNHVLDWGREGLLETLACLDRHGVKGVGAGRDAAEAGAPAILDVAGKGRVLVFAFAMATSGVPPGWAAGQDRPGVSFLRDLSDAAVADVAGRVRAVRRQGDVVVVSIHWGSNWGYDVPQDQQRFARALIDEADVSVVHGHSSHHAKAIEVHRRRLILYGCGDFLNDYEGIAGYEEFRDDLAIMYFARVDPPTGDLLGLDMVPLQIARFRLNRPSRDDVAWLHGTLDRESSRFDARVARSADDHLTLSPPDVHSQRGER